MSYAPRLNVVYSPGDILVEAAEGGSFQVSRVGANGGAYVLGFQQSEPAALGMAGRATSGHQRVYLRLAPGSDEYRLVESV